MKPSATVKMEEDEESSAAALMDVDECLWKDVSKLTDPISSPQEKFELLPAFLKVC